MKISFFGSLNHGFCFTERIGNLEEWATAVWIFGGVKLITALASVITAVLLIRYFPSALHLPTPSALQKARSDIEREVIDRVRAEDSARSAIAADAAGLGFWSFDVAAHALHWD